MKLTFLRLSNFQCFGPEPITITFEDTTFLVGPNGAGKTAVLHALARLFGVSATLRRIRKSDFHAAASSAPSKPNVSNLWLEAQFEFPEAGEDAEEGTQTTIPPHFAHMRLETADGSPRVRFRLSATLDADGEIEETLEYVLETDKKDLPKKRKTVPKIDRKNIHVHYLPARRDPAEHISYAANALLGRVLRSAEWGALRDDIREFAAGITNTLGSSDAVSLIGSTLSKNWGTLHRGDYFGSPQVAFNASDLDSLLRHLTVAFSPGHAEQEVDFSRLSDGQQSLLYVSLVLSVHALGRALLDGSTTAFDPLKLQPPVFTMVAMEEPENSLSPHYLGRVVRALCALGKSNDAQAIVATHAPPLLRRVEPENIRYLRLDEQRHTSVATIVMPPDDTEANKFVREAVLAFPEIYFSRLAILGEGDSELLVLPRLLRAKGLAEDDASIAVVPLGGRHVNHFWRLLHGLGIPYVTLLDLDLGRYQGGWGRIRYALEQLLAFPPATVTHTAADLDEVPKWNSGEHLPTSDHGKEWLSYLEDNNVFFSVPLDLDLAMLLKFTDAFTDDDEGDDQDDEEESNEEEENDDDQDQGDDDQDQDDDESDDDESDDDENDDDEDDDDEDDDDENDDDENDDDGPDEKTIVAVLGKKHINIDEYSENDDWYWYFEDYHRIFKLGSKPAAHVGALARLDDERLVSDMPEPLGRLIDTIKRKLAKLPE